MKLSKYFISTIIDDKENSQEGAKYIIYSCISNVIVIVNETIFNQMVNGIFDQMEDSIKKELENANIIIHQEQDELQNILEENISHNDIFSMFLNISNGCSSGCRKCVGITASSGMNGIVLKSLNQFTENEFKKLKYKAFNVIWNINDPNKDLHFIIEISEIFQILTSQYALLYTSMIMCNISFINKSLFTILFNKCMIRNYRITINGNDLNTNQIIENILSILDEFPFLPQDGIIFEISICINTFSQNEIYDIIDKFISNETQNRVTFQFIVFENESSDIESLASDEVEYLLYAIQNGFIIGILPARSFVSCAAVDDCAVTIDTNGNLYSCNVLPYASEEVVKTNTLGNIILGKEANSSSAQFRNWFHEIRNSQSPCINCNLLPVCGGGCRLKWTEGKVGCPMFRYNMEDRLVLSYLNQKMHMSEYIFQDN